MMCPYIGIRHERSSSGFARERARSWDGRARVRLPLPSSASGSAAARNAPSQVRLDLGGKRGQGLGDECRGAEDATSGGYVGIT